MRRRFLLTPPVLIIAMIICQGLEAATKECPFPDKYIVVDQFYHDCNNGRLESCDYFLDELVQLFPRYDCQRNYDTSPVPAIWLYGAAMEDYFKLLYHLASRTDGMFGVDKLAEARYRAREIFLSDNFKSVLDGYIASEYFPLIDKMEKNAP